MARVAALLVLLFIGASGADRPLTAYLRRVGPYRVGMTLGDMRRLLGDRQASLYKLEGPECSYVESEKKPDGLGFMFFYRKLVRIEVHNPGIPTASGIQVGDPAEKVLQAYPGQIKVETHPYGDEPAHYLFYTPKDRADRGYSIIFESWDGKVTSYRIGKEDAVGLIEGCA